jgi:stage II sporulation protein GA (sporulation sigma-E factor processing peptidase)
MYADILLVENFIINYLLLSITSRFSKIEASRARLLLSSGIGALYIIIVFFPSLKIFLTLSMKIAVSVLMIIIAFAPERFRDFFKALGVFYIISFAFGGAAFSLFYFTGNGNVINGAFYIKDFPLSLLIIAFAASYMLLVYCWDYVQGRVLNDGLKYDIIIVINKRQVEVKAILDTGNSL